MKSMVKILVTIMALSLAEAPVFAAWPAERMNKAAKVKHLVSTYGCNHAEINKLTVPNLNELEAELSAAAVVPAPVDMAMVVGGGAGLELGDGGQDGNKRKRLPDLGRSGAPSVEFSTERDLQIALGQVAMTKEAEVVARGKLDSLAKHFQEGGDKAGHNPADFAGFKKFKSLAEQATLAHRQAKARLASLLQQNSLYEYFAPIAEALNAFDARAAALTVAEIERFIVMITDIIAAVELKSGTMSAGTQAIYYQYVKPFNDYAQALRLYVAELEKNKKELIARAGGLSAIDFSSGALIAAATLAGAVVGWQAGVAIIVGTTLIPFTPAAIYTFQGGVVVSGAFTGGALAAMVTQGGATGPATESSAKKRKHDGDDKV